MDPRLKETISLANETRGANAKESLLDQMIKERLQFCLTSCQNNKVVCLLQPKCENRRFLDVLILVERVGHSLQKFALPSFCYSQRIAQYERFFRDSVGELPPDTYITADDLWLVLTGKKKKEKERERSLGGISSTLAKTIRRAPFEFEQKTGNLRIILAKDHLAVIDEATSLCLLNPQREPIRSIEVLEAIAKVLSKKHRLKVKVDKAPALGVSLILKASFVVESEEQLFDVSDLIVGYDRDKIVVEVPVSPLDMSIPMSIGELASVFDRLARLVGKSENVVVGEDGEKEEEESPKENVVVTSSTPQPQGHQRS